MNRFILFNVINCLNGGRASGMIIEFLVVEGGILKKPLR